MCIYINIYMYYMLRFCSLMERNKNIIKTNNKLHQYPYIRHVHPTCINNIHERERERERERLGHQTCGLS